LRSKCAASKAVRAELEVGGKPDDSALAPGALVFTPSAGPVPLNDLSAWWRWVHGANWRHPTQFQRDAGSGLTLLIQNESLGKDKETNWLPAPKGPFDGDAPLLAESLPALDRQKRFENSPVRFIEDAWVQKNDEK